MDLAHAIRDLDEHPWADTTHAYGSADDLPDLLRAFAGDDEDASEEALSELYSSVLHQGTVYAASADVAPWLARIGAAGHRTGDVLALLGGMAASDDEHQVAPGAVRAAVAAQLPLLIPLLAVDDPGVRSAAAWALAQTGMAEVVLGALRGRWETEREPLVRAELLSGLAQLDPSGTAPLAEEMLDPAQPAELRMAAVFGCLDAGLPWGTTLHDTVLSLLPAHPLMSDRLDLGRKEPLYEIVGELLRHDTDTDRAAVADLLDVALRDPRLEVRREALWATDHACMLSRSAPQRLLPALLPLVTDAASIRDVLHILFELGPVAADSAPQLVVLAQNDRDSDLADRALKTLVAVAPRRATAPLARDLGNRPRGLNALTGFREQEEWTCPFDSELLAAIRVRLTEDGLQGNEPGQLTRLLAHWGERSAAVLPDLYAALPRFPRQAASAIAAIAAGCPEAERLRAAQVLRAEAADGPVPVAHALYRLTGESDALLKGLAGELAQGAWEVAEAARTAAELGPDAMLLVPNLRGALSGPDHRSVTPVLDADVALAAALFRVEGDPEAVVPVLDSVFARAAGKEWFRWTAIRAARVASGFGPAGRPLVAHLERMLSDPQQAPAAVSALVAVAEPASLERPLLAETVLRSAERGINPGDALDALAALGSAGPVGGAWGADLLRRLAALADRDLRVIHSGFEDQVIQADERLRVRAREVLTAWTGGGR